jgi:hypothetical protein
MFEDYEAWAYGKEKSRVMVGWGNGTLVSHDSRDCLKNLALRQV